MSQSTKPENSTDIRVPSGTVRVLEEEILGPYADEIESEEKASSDGYAASAAWECLEPMASEHRLRFDLTNAGDRAGAVWLLYELKQLLEGGEWTIPEPIYPKRDVLRRIADELYETLQAGAVEGVDSQR